MIQGLISCVFPTHRGGRFVNERLYELSNSTYKNLEIILVEDGPVKPYILLPELNIKVIKLAKNSGSVSIPRAVGLSYAKGEFIAPIDDDVIILPTKFEELINGIGNSYLCYGNRLEMYMPNTPKNNSNEIIIDRGAKITNWDPLELEGWGVDNGQYIYRAEVWKKNKFIFPKRACDWETAKLIAKEDNNFKFVDTDVCIYLWHKDNRNYDDSTKTKEIYPEQYREYFNQDFINF